MMMQSVAKVDYERLTYVADIATMMQRTLDFMAANGQCTRADATTLCIADDTAAWLCGRTDVCTFASFRVRIAAFKHPCPILKHFLFEESLAQRCGGPMPRYTYMNYSLFKNLLAIKLTVYTDDPHADGLPYFVKFENGRAKQHVRQTAAVHYKLPAFEQCVEENYCAVGY
ncbi:late expression factor 12 [Choristoneura fumiferana DEF multiple nucleopolyhedrovirus]|uniref:Late expression factor 12 n=1 Tax=Choristoneura fumiferana defective polyhedrosis virus TaxID=74660 RepID=Q6VTU8_NPVCD|nr:late expression factor 12 [Choristoneura fumiferana DEF multiple nucleopolyhedrovirus]AAQ91728.1 late expression factor 12 [Choristoneura fumiferana DEF multiple nucleopolyhedrovirus]